MLRTEHSTPGISQARSKNGWVLGVYGIMTSCSSSSERSTPEISQARSKNDWVFMAQWPHAPLHLLKESGVYMVTATTYLKTHYFQTQQRLQLLYDSLLTLSNAFGWELHAWAVFSNHYHFIAKSPTDPSTLKFLIGKIHRSTTEEINKQDGMPNRKVWHQYWDSKITVQSSYMARLNYVHQNAVKHGLVLQASFYPWCSAAKFEKDGSASFIRVCR